MFRAVIIIPPLAAGVVSVIVLIRTGGEPELALLTVASKMLTVLFTGFVTYSRFKCRSSNMKLAPAPAVLAVVEAAESFIVLRAVIAPVPESRMKSCELSRLASIHTGDPTPGTANVPFTVRFTGLILVIV